MVKMFVQQIFLSTTQSSEAESVWTSLLSLRKLKSRGRKCCDPNSLSCDCQEANTSFQLQSHWTLFTTKWPLNHKATDSVNTAYSCAQVTKLYSRPCTSTLAAAPMFKIDVSGLLLWNEEIWTSFSRGWRPGCFPCRSQNTAVAILRQVGDAHQNFEVISREKLFHKWF